MKISDYNELFAAANELKAQAEGLNLKAEKLLSLVGWHEPLNRVTVAQIQKLTAECFDVTVKDLKGRSKKEFYVLPRHVAMYLVRELLKPSLQAIGEGFGGRDHGTVMNALRHVNDILQTQPAVRARIENLRRIIEERMQ